MSKNSRREKPRNVRRHLRFESMESRRLLAADVFQHNFDMPDDVNGDQFVSPMDALAVINHLNSSNNRSSNINNSLASVESAQEATYLDVNDDGLVSPMDALSIINSLNCKSAATAATTPTTTNTGEVDQQGEHEGQFGDQNDANELAETSELPETNELPDTETNDDGVLTTPPVTTIPRSTPPVITPVTSTPTTPVVTTPVVTTPVVTTPVTTTPITTTPAVPKTPTKTGTTTPTSRTNFDDDDTNEGNEASESAETISQRLVSTLQGTGAETARVVFESGTENGAAQNELEVRVRNSTPSSTLDVVIDGVTVGSVMTDASGNGALQLTTDPDGRPELPLPANFPVIATGSTIEIGTDLSGTFTANPNNPTLPTTTTPAAVTLQPQRLTSIGQGNSHHRSRHR
ncbi:MAG: hypothetical protein IT422_05410 [Pirellulaceae bacterium]|nr:hypothetical protein [Pirellulaceae bacterium]